VAKSGGTRSKEHDDVKVTRLAILYYRVTGRQGSCIHPSAFTSFWLLQHIPAGTRIPTCAPPVFRVEAQDWDDERTPRVDTMQAVPHEWTLSA
jgi:hypothetical protein